MTKNIQNELENGCPTGPKTRPWNQANLPVFSLSSMDKEAKTGNMNICTYASAITMKPKKFMVGVYRDTKTYENISKFKRCLLQILSKKQLSLVRKFGKSSGYEADKLRNMKHMLSEHEGLFYLSECVSFIHLSLEKIIPVGDHDIFIMSVLNHKSLNHPKDILYLYDLKKAKIIL